MMLVSHIIANRSQPFILRAEMSILEASRFLRDHHIGGAPVTKNGQLVGFCSERDVVYRLVAEKRDPSKVAVAEIMSANVISATPEHSVSQCEEMMREAHVRHIPIVDDGEIIACISLRNLIQSELVESQIEVECLTTYIRGA